MDKEELKKEVCKNLRSVTQSCKGGVPFQRLQYDYKALLGTDIPYKNLGYESLEAFIWDIPDFVRIKITKNQRVVEGVADKSTAHIASMISKQKSSKSGLVTVKVKKKVKQPTPTIQRVDSISHGIQSLLHESQSINIVSANDKTSAGNATESKSSVPIYNENILDEYSLPLKVPGVAVSEEPLHLELSSNKFVADELLIDSDQNSVVLKATNQVDWEDINSKDGLSSEDIRIGRVIEKKKRTRRKIKKASQILNSPLNLEKGGINQNNEPSTQSNASVVNDDQKKEELRNSVKINLGSIVMSSKDGVLLDNLQSDYHKIVGTKIPYDIFGYQSLQSFIQSIPDVVTLKMNNVGKLVAQAVPDASTSHIFSLISRQKSSQKKGKKLLQNTIKPPKVKSLPKVSYPPVVLKSKEVVKLSTESLNLSFTSNCSSKDVSSLSFTSQETSKGRDISTKGSNPVWSGKSLGSFPCIKDNINNAHFSTLLGLHNLIFGVSYMDTLKEKILKFGGFLFLKGSEEWKKRKFLLSVLPADGLAEYLNLLCVRHSNTDEKHMLLEKLLTFITLVPSEMIDPEKKIENKLADSDIYKKCQEKDKQITKLTLENKNLMTELLNMKNEHKKILEEMSLQKAAALEVQSDTSSNQAKDNIIIAQSAEIDKLKSELAKLTADGLLALRVYKKEKGQLECQLNKMKHDKKVEAKNFEKQKKQLENELNTMKHDKKVEAKKFEEQRIECVKYISALSSKTELTQKAHEAKIIKMEQQLCKYEDIFSKVHEQSSLLRSQIEDLPSCPPNIILPVIKQLLSISNGVHLPKEAHSSSQTNNNESTNQLS